MTSSKCLALPSKPLKSETNRYNADFSSRCSARTDSDALEYSHETYDAASVQSGDTSLLGQQSGENVVKKSSLRLGVRRLYSKWQKMHGNRFSILFCAVSAGIVALINSVLTIWAWKSFGVKAGFGTIQHGNCDQTKKLSLWLHLAINALGTALLSASNYTMQCLSSPTRQDIDKAHFQCKWLDIGVPSLRNLRRITWKRIILWWLLAITSLPLHLMYNSAVFETLSTHEYEVYVVSKDFLPGAPFKIPPPHLFYSPDENFAWRFESFRNPNSDIKLKNSTARECILTYENGLANSKYKDVLAVSSANNATNSLLYLWSSKNSDMSQQMDLWFCEHYEHDRQ